MDSKKVREIIEDVLYPWAEDVDKFILPYLATRDMKWEGKGAAEIVDEIIKKIESHDEE